LKRGELPVRSPHALSYRRNLTAILVQFSSFASLCTRFERARHIVSRLYRLVIFPAAI